MRIESESRSVRTSKHNHGTLFCLTLALFTAASTMQATPITAVVANTDMGTLAGDITHIVDGSGLSAYNFSATHAAGDGTNDWNGLNVTGTVTFNLGGLYNLDGMAVWNFNSINSRGVNAVTVTGSTDGVTFLAIAGAPTSFLQQFASAAEPAQIFSFSTTASFIRFTITSNFGSPNGSGLNEVMFDAVPEPASCALLGAGLAALAYLRRRRVG